MLIDLFRIELDGLGQTGDDNALRQAVQLAQTFIEPAIDDTDLQAAVVGVGRQSLPVELRGSGGEVEPGASDRGDVGETPLFEARRRNAQVAERLASRGAQLTQMRTLGARQRRPKIGGRGQQAVLCGNSRHRSLPQAFAGCASTLSPGATSSQE